MTYRLSHLDLDGNGPRPRRVYDLPGSPDQNDYWAGVTDVPCPRDGCAGTICWAEAGHVPGYRICDACGAHFIARGTTRAPILILRRPASKNTRRVPRTIRLHEVFAQSTHSARNCTCSHPARAWQDARVGSLISSGDVACDDCRSWLLAKLGERGLTLREDEAGRMVVVASDDDGAV